MKDWPLEKRLDKFFEFCQEFDLRRDQLLAIKADRKEREIARRLAIKEAKAKWINFIYAYFLSMCLLLLYFSQRNYLY
jgi:hypothetical protein